MSFTVADFHDLTRLLEERPDWREELRRLVLADRLLALPDQIAEQRLETDRRFQEVAEQIARLAEELATLTRTVRGLADDVGKLKGSDLERRFRERSFAHFGRLIRRARVLTQEELADILDSGMARGAITESDADELQWADLIVRGKRRDDGADVSLVVEISYGVGVHDVERAERRAQLYGRMVTPVLPVVAGEAVTADAAQCARAAGVWQLIHGRVVAPDTA